MKVTTVEKINFICDKFNGFQQEITPFVRMITLCDLCGTLVESETGISMHYTTRTNLFMADKQIDFVFFLNVDEFSSWINSYVKNHQHYYRLAT